MVRSLFRDGRASFIRRIWPSVTPSTQSKSLPTYPTSSVQPTAETVSPVVSPLPRVLFPTLDDFRRDWFEPQLPVVIEGAMENWSARNWTLDTLVEKFGQNTIHVELSRWNNKERRWADFRDLYKNREPIPKEELFMPQHPILLEDFVNIFLRDYEDISSPLKGYLAQQQLLDDLPALAEGILDPEYATLTGGIYQRNIWLGPLGTITPLHRDPYHNILAQVWGSKYIRIYSPSESKKLYPFKTNLYLRNTSEVDIDAPDAYRKWPDLQNAPYFDCTLKSGEMIYIPIKCFQEFEHEGKMLRIKRCLSTYEKDEPWRRKLFGMVR